MAVPLIDFGVIKKGSLSPCLTKKSSELRRAACFGNAASEPLQNPAFPMTQISNALFHTEVSLSTLQTSKLGLGECASSSLLQLPHSPAPWGSVLGSAWISKLQAEHVVWLPNTKPLEKLCGTAEDCSGGRAFIVLGQIICSSLRY